MLDPERGRCPEGGMGPWGDKGRAGQSQLLCVVIEVTQGTTAGAQGGAGTGRTGQASGFSVEEG